jgi:hypothetical protein
MTEIGTLTQQINQYGADQTAVLDALGVAEQQAIDAANNADTVSAGFLSTTALQKLYFDPVNGNDANNGSSAALAVKTWTVLTALFSAVKLVQIWCLSDGVVDRNVVLKTCPAKIYFIGRNAANSAYEARTITFTDSTNLPNFAGGIYLSNSCDIQSYYMSFVLGHTGANGPFHAFQCYVGLWLLTTTITRTSTGGPMLTGAFNGHLFGSGLIVDPSAAGKVISGVPAAGDPNALRGFSSNFTSL